MLLANQELIFITAWRILPPVLDVNYTRDKWIYPGVYVLVFYLRQNGFMYLVWCHVSIIIKVIVHIALDGRTYGLMRAFTLKVPVRTTHVSEWPGLLKHTHPVLKHMESTPAQGLAYMGGLEQGKGSEKIIDWRCYIKN